MKQHTVGIDISKAHLDAHRLADGHSAQFDNDPAGFRALEAREAQLHPGQAIGEKKQISFADHDARMMKHKGGFEYAYNAQISVDEKTQVIVGQHVSQQANDSRQVSRALEEVETSTGRLPQKLSLDNGYYSGQNLQEVQDRKVDAYIATDRGEKRGKGSLEASDRRLVKADFGYDEERDGFHCPGGQLLTLNPSVRRSRSRRALTIRRSCASSHARCSTSHRSLTSSITLTT